LSHVYQNPDRKRFFRKLDQGMIFLLIAGTYTPFAFALAPMK
jgi:channel protein (hemolysin III family)